MVKTQDTLPGSGLFADGPGNASAPALGRQSGAGHALPPPPSVDPAKLRKVLHAQRKEDKAAKKASKKVRSHLPAIVLALMLATRCSRHFVMGRAGRL